KALALEFSGIEDRGGEEIGGNRYVQGDQGVRGLSVVIVQGTGQSGVEHPEIKAQVNFALGLPFEVRVGIALRGINRGETVIVQVIVQAGTRAVYLFGEVALGGKGP